ncbi:MAG: MarR family transcriptional regulator [Hyphomicrobiales bacterium]|nr:MarR family transcriptional regulator [Hyphomicrobiales bacterium]
MTFKKMNSPGYLINHMARLFAQGLRDEIAPLGIAPAQFMALLELWNEDGLTQKELVERLDVEQATIANTITRMERDGLIERRSHPDDGRARLIYATDKARLLEANATKSAMTINRAFLHALSPDEQQQFTDFMQRVIADIKKSGD